MTLAAYTPAGNLPPYLNIRMDGDDVRITVRSAGVDGPLGVRQGDTGTILLKAEQFSSTLWGALENLARFKRTGK